MKYMRCRLVHQIGRTHLVAPRLASRTAHTTRSAIAAVAWLCTFSVTMHANKESQASTAISGHAPQQRYTQCGCMHWPNKKQYLIGEVSCHVYDKTSAAIALTPVRTSWRAIACRAEHGRHLGFRGASCCCRCHSRLVTPCRRRRSCRLRCCRCGH